MALERKVELPLEHSCQRKGLQMTGFVLLLLNFSKKLFNSELSGAFVKTRVSLLVLISHFLFSLSRSKI